MILKSKSCYNTRYAPSLSGLGFIRINPAVRAMRKSNTREQKGGARLMEKTFILACVIGLVKSQFRRCDSDNRVNFDKHKRGNKLVNHQLRLVS